MDIDALKARTDLVGSCWEWRDGRTMKGYGRIKIAGRQIGAHRVAYATANGLDVGALPSSVVIRHSCDNPPCVNPAHLEPGTHLDNARDMWERGRAPSQAQSHCTHGHPYNEANTRIDTRGRRHCRHCDRIRSRKRFVGKYRHRLP